MEPEEMRVVTQFASLAPSVHNTQPWSFVAHPNALDVHSDPARQLHYLDPFGRQLHISCGLATEFARLAIRSLGFDCATTVCPSTADATLVARIEIGRRRPVTGDEQLLIDAAARRYTDRGPYADEPLTAAELERLRGAVTQPGCWMRVLDRHEDRLAALVLLSDAEAAEASDPQYHAELAEWRRAGHSDDGLPEAAYATWDDASRVSDVPLRDFSGRDVHPRPDGGVPPRVERDTIVVVGTEADDQISWIRAGIALADLLLTLTDANLVSQPLGPVLDLPTARARLRYELGFVGYPQLILRVGRGSGRPATGRRSMADVLTVGT